MTDLTNTEQKLLISMYRFFLERQPALSEYDARFIGNSDNVRDMFAPELPYEYVAELCWNLCRAGYILCDEGDNLANNIELSRKTIIYMEQRFSRNLHSIASFLCSLRK